LKRNITNKANRDEKIAFKLQESSHESFKEANSNLIKIKQNYDEEFKKIDSKLEANIKFSKN